MFHGLSISAWLPVLVVAFAFLAGGIILALVSYRAGQYRDPEAAKYAVLDDDTHPARDSTDTASS